MKIADDLGMLNIKMNLTGTETNVHPTLIWDDENVILVDTGAPHSINEIKTAIEKAGLPSERLNKIILTHQDMDHIGGVNDIQEKLPGVEILAHRDDVPYIQGEKRLVRLNSKFMDRINNLPEKQKEHVLKIFNNVHVKVNTTLTDCEKLAYCGGIIVIHTPGHTPGHICLYHIRSKTLIAGDAMNIINEQLTGPNKQIINEEDVKTAVNSLKKLKDYDIRYVITYHGGLFKDNPNQRIKELILEEKIL